MTKRALIIAFHFPPQSGSSGIQRTLSLTKHLGEWGWEPLVLSASPRAYGKTDLSQLAEIPSNVVVRRTFALDAKRHLAIFGRYPELMALPDRWISWYLSAVPAGLAMIRKYRPDVIWSTFPIPTAHLIGLTLHRLSGLPWVADIRDPMLQASFPSTKLQRSVYGWIERKTITACAKAVFTTPGARNRYQQRFPDLPADKFVVVENGYDESAFERLGLITPPPLSTSSRPITLLHSGVLYQTGRDPAPFFEAVNVLKKRGDISANTLKIVLRAPSDISWCRSRIQKYDVADIVSAEPAIPYAEALREMLLADGLLLLQGSVFNTQIPAKMYEYFRARRPIFALGDASGETANRFFAAGFEDFAPIGDAHATTRAFSAFLAKVRTGCAPIASEHLVQASSRATRAGELAQIFNQLVPAERPKI